MSLDEPVATRLCCAERFLCEPSVRVTPGKAHPAPSWISMFCTTGTRGEEEGWEEEEDDTQTEEGLQGVSAAAVPTLLHGDGLLLGKANPLSMLRVVWGVHRASQCLFLGVDLEVCGEMAAALLCFMFHH